MHVNRRFRRGWCRLAVTVAVVGFLWSITGALAADSRQRVFRHICEVPSLQHILSTYTMARRDHGTTISQADSVLHVVGDFRFEDARCYFELYPAPGSDELWILDGDSPPGSPDFPVPLVVLRVVKDRILVSTGLDADTLWHPLPHLGEARLELQLENDVLRIADTRHPSRVREFGVLLFPLEVPVPAGMYLAIPEGEPDGSGCGFAALEIYLDKQDVPRWEHSVTVR